MKLIYITSSHSCNFWNKLFIRNSLCSLSPYLHTYTVERSDSVFFITVYTYLHSGTIWHCVLLCIQRMEILREKQEGTERKEGEGEKGWMGEIGRQRGKREGVKEEKSTCNSIKLIIWFNRMPWSPCTPVTSLCYFSFTTYIYSCYTYI